MKAIIVESGDHWMRLRNPAPSDVSFRGSGLAGLAPSAFPSAFSFGFSSGFSFGLTSADLASPSFVASSFLASSFFLSSFSSGALASAGLTHNSYSPVASLKYAIHRPSGDHAGSRS